MARLTQRLGLTRFEADEYYRKGLAAYEKRQFDEAVLNLTDAIAALPNHAEYYAARGLVYLDDGIDDKAGADFQQALRHYPYELLAHYGLGVIATREKHWQEALDHFTRAYRINPKRPEPLYYLAICYYHLEQPANALHIMKQAQEALDAAGDKRKSDAAKWIRLLEKSLATPPARSAPGLATGPRIGGLAQPRLPERSSTPDDDA